jgi:HK97 gp10 family phage protein
MSIQMQAVGVKDLTSQLRKIARSMGGVNTANALAAGAQVIVEAAQENVLEKGIYDTGALYDSIRAKKVNQYRVDIEVGVPYAAAHEFGYDGGKEVTITPRQRAFFWFKYYETANEMWKALALSTTYTLAAVPARPYLRPAIDENKHATALAVKVELARILTRKLGIAGG